MLAFGVFLLIPSAILAAGYGNQYYSTPSSVPMDFYDDVYNKDLGIKTDGNFVYNFEQIRNDQPPHVEMREENLGKYMHRPRPSTTIAPMQMHAHNTAVHNNYNPVPHAPQVQQHYDNQWSSPSTQRPHSIPPAPQWNDFPQIFNGKPQQSHQYESQYNTYTQPQAHDQHRPAHIAPNTHQTPIVVPEAPMVENHNFRGHQNYQNAPGHGQHQQTVNRGSHKFSWDDVTPQAPQYNNPPTTTMVTPVNHQARNSARPIPTLSPWHGDNFGK